jgi:hypothetical protein
MSQKLANVRKPDIHIPAITGLAASTLGRIVQRIRTIRLNIWTGKVEVSETTTTIEPMEPRDERP